MTTTLENPENEAAGRAQALPDGPDIIEAAIASENAVSTAENMIREARGSATGIGPAIAGVHPKAAIRCATPCCGRVFTPMRSTARYCPPCRTGSAKYYRHVDKHLEPSPTPSKDYDAQHHCQHCGEPFNALSPKAKYCSNPCRQAAYRGRTTNRAAILAEFDEKCAVCKKPGRMGEAKISKYGKWSYRLSLVIRLHRDFGRPVALCARCSSARSRSLFYQRVPNPGRHYAKRVYIAKRNAGLSAQEALVRGGGRKLCKMASASP